MKKRSVLNSSPIRTALYRSIVAIGVAALPLASVYLAQVAEDAVETEAARSAPTTMLRMKTGDILWGSIVAHTSEGISFERLDTGGTIELAWSFLDASEEEALRLRFGYVDPTGEEMMVEAERLVLIDGTEITGTIVNRTDEHLWLKSAGGTIPIALNRLQGASTRVIVPALDIYAREELYQMKAFELQATLLMDGLEGARAHDELAKYSERLFDYVHAVLHYGLVKTLAPDFELARVGAAFERCEAKAAVQGQVDELEAIERFRVRKRYDLALEGLRVFPELHPDSPLMDDWNKLRDRVARHQERDVRDEIQRRVFGLSVTLARDAARQKVTYEQVLAYLDETMAIDLFSGVQADLQRIAPDIETDLIQRLWSERSGGRYRQASFGLGTWLLGESRALETYDEEDDRKKAVKPKKGSQAEARLRLEERIKRYLQNQALTRKARSGGVGTDEDPNKFWAEWDSAGRRHWILAYFVEFAGVFRVERVRFANCRECGGSGAREVVFSGSAIAGQSAQGVLTPCASCHTIGRVRRVRYR